MELDPEEISLIKDGKGVELIRRGVRQGISKIVKAFPNSSPHGHVGLLDEDGREIGMIRSLEKLDTASRDLLDEALRVAYYVPLILEILSVESQGGGYGWQVSMESGEQSFRTQGAHALDTSRFPKIVVTDENGRRYHIEDYSTLDAYSKEALRDLLPDYLRRAQRGYSSRRMRRKP